MDKIRNLQETIYNEKQDIKALEKELNFRKGILRTHERALERMLTPQEYSPVLKEKASPQASQEQETPNSTSRERITLDNWYNLGIEAGDKVEIVISSDSDFSDNSMQKVLRVEDRTYSGNFILELDSDKDGENNWYHVFDDDEIYLIRTPEGSLK
jgi:hypothetical protein